MSESIVRAASVQPREREDRRTKRQPPYAVIVLNDNDHTFQYVVTVFSKVFGYNQEKCFQLAKEIHLQGRGIVWSGALEVAELKREQIRGMGPDRDAVKVVNYPLGVEIEPLP